MAADASGWRWTDLVVRVPLVGAALVAVCLTAFLVVSYRQVTGELESAGRLRAQAAADQLASLLTQSIQQQLTELQRTVQDPAVRGYLAAPTDALAAAARRRLAPLSRPGQPPAEIWSAAGVKLLAGPPPASERPVPATPPMAPPKAEGVGVFQSSGDAVYWNTVAAAPGGYLVQRRILTSTGNPDAITRLVGAGAVIKLGDGSGRVWSDLARRTSGPAATVRPGAISFDDERAGQLQGAAAPVRGTPWLVLVGFPRALTIAPARSYLLRMLVVAGLFVLGAAAAAAMLSARITTPLRQLTHDAEAIAAGRFEHSAGGTTRRDEIGRLAGAFSAMSDQVQASRQQLETRVEDRTNAVVALNRELEARLAELKTLAGELEAFSYSVSHDLRAPLRHISGFATLLEQRSQSALDAESVRYVRTIVSAASRMGRLIDDLLAFSRMGRTEMLQQRVDLALLVRSLIEEARLSAPERDIVWNVGPLPAVRGDAAMLRLAFSNLLSNAVKYSAPRRVAHIDIGVLPGSGGECVLYVRDDGVGFDMQYVEKLFGVFQRLHGADSFDGTGIGLANVRRIVHRHDGRTWAEGAVDGGATFFLSLPEWSGVGAPLAAAAAVEAV